MNLFSLLLLFSFNNAIYGKDEKDNALKSMYEWKYVEYKWESEEQKKNLMDSGDYNSSASILVDADMSADNRIFVTICREQGVPATLGVVTNETGPGGPLVEPYPSWEFNQDQNCSTLVNVVHITIDECDQLWVMDNGIVNNKTKCPPKIVVFNLTSDEVIKSMEIPNDLKAGPLGTIFVHHMNPHCASPLILIAAKYKKSFVIYDGKKFCYSEPPSLQKQNGAEQFKIGEENFTLDKGITSMALVDRVGPDLVRKTPTIYIKSFSSNYMYFVTVTYFTNYCETKRDPYFHRMSYEVEFHLSSLTAANRILFFGSIEDDALYCYNPSKRFTNTTYVFLHEDKERLQWVNSIKSTPKSLEFAQSLLILSNRYQKVISQTMNFDEVNFRIMYGNADELVFDTNCY